MLNSSILPIDRTPLSATTNDQSGLGSDDNEGVLRIPQSFGITGVTLSDCLVSYLGHTLLGSYPSAEMQSVCSTVPIFILRPTSVRMWHKAVFKVGPVAGPKPNATGSSKNASDPVGIPLFWAPQASGDKPNPSEEG